jgi:hypothetical protein
MNNLRSHDNPCMSRYTLLTVQDSLSNQQRLAQPIMLAMAGRTPLFGPAKPLGSDMQTTTIKGAEKFLHIWRPVVIGR